MGELSDPLEKLTNVVADLESGNLEVIASEEGILELSQLSRGINGLATSVRQSNEFMQSEIDLATNQLKVALAELEQAMRAKDQFLARMSHELRTPLTAVLGFSNMLFEKDSESKREEQLRVIQRCSTVLLTMIDDVLDFAKADLGGFTLNNINFSLDEFLEDLTTLFRFQANEKGLEFSMCNEGEVPKSIHSDPVRLAQVITNLVNNAIKFTNSGSIVITMSIEGCQDGYDYLKFVVKDTERELLRIKS